MSLSMLPVLLSSPPGPDLHRPCCPAGLPTDPGNFPPALRFWPMGGTPRTFYESHFPDPPRPLTERPVGSPWQPLQHAVLVSKPNE